MADNMTIGPAMNVGNNQVQMTRKGKVKITNPEGNVITLSKDQFKKQIIKNADLINAGGDVEFQKGGDKKGLKIAGAAVGIAAIATGIVYRKNIAKYMKDFSLKNLGEDIKGLFGKAKGKVEEKFSKLKKNDKLEYSIFSGEKSFARNASEAKVAEETLRMKNEVTANIANDIINSVEKLKKTEKGGAHTAKQKMYNNLFKDTAETVK